ncbi:equilibrative nucleobase transporter 1-like [Heterodontus francisci]|uniref:equilibrative nucleobase transporter 1-like n=1 Tax=Heterodontus francisci TaxID=7792 RepID=UPI00355BE3C9
MTNMQVGNLFGNRRSTIITLYNGAFDSSSAVFLVVKVLYEAGLSLMSMFLFISCLSSIHILRTIFLLPRTHIPYPLPKGYTYGVSCDKFGLTTSSSKEETASQRKPLRGGGGTEGETSERWDVTEGDKVERQEIAEKVDDVTPQLKGSKDSDGNEEEIPSFRSCIFSKLFLTHLLWLSILQLRHYLFIGTLNPMLTLLTSGDPGQVSRFTNAFAFTQFCGVFCAPWNGMIMDRHKRKAKPSDTASESTGTQRLADMKSAVLSLAITVTQCVLFSLCAAIPVLQVQYLTFVLQVINRSFLYGGHAAFTAIGFPPCHFGKVYGMLMALSAVVSLLQYPCFALIKGPLQDDPMYMNIGFIVLVTLAYVHPINVYLQVRRETRRRGAVKPPRVEVQGLGEMDNRPASDTDI